VHNHNHSHGFNKENRHENLYRKDHNKTAEQAKAQQEKAEQAKTAEAEEEAVKDAEAKQAQEQPETAETQEQTAEQAKAAEATQPDPRDKKIEELQNQLARLQADFSNVRKRSAQDQERLAAFVTASVTKEFLKVLDNFERAEDSMKQQGATAEAMHEGMTKIHKQFQQALQALKIEEIPAQGQKFDPQFHEAVMQNTASDLPDETIDLVAEKGYKIGDNIIRHSKVRVVHNS
jgi:molecular chaperone GrpE